MAPSPKRERTNLAWIVATFALPSFGPHSKTLDCGCNGTETCNIKCATIILWYWTKHHVYDNKHFVVDFNEFIEPGINCLCWPRH